MRRAFASSIFAWLAFSYVCAATAADEPCMDFKWDVSKERALYAGAASPLTAGIDFKFSPVAFPDRLYEIKLNEQEKVAFSVPPGKQPQGEQMHAGVLYVRVAVPGIYRIASDASVWIDVVAHGALLEPKDFQGQHGCSAPRKIVEFELSDTGAYIVQLSGAAPGVIRVVLTAAPERTL